MIQFDRKGHVIIIALEGREEEAYTEACRCIAELADALDRVISTRRDYHAAETMNELGLKAAYRAQEAALRDAAYTFAKWRRP